MRQLCSNPIWLDDVSSYAYMYRHLHFVSQESRSSSQLLIAKHIMNKCHMVWSVFDSNDGMLTDVILYCLLISYNQGHTSVLLANFRYAFNSIVLLLEIASLRKEFPLLHNIQLLPLALFRYMVDVDTPC